MDKQLLDFIRKNMLIDMMHESISFLQDVMQEENRKKYIDLFIKCQYDIDIQEKGDLIFSDN